MTDIDSELKNILDNYDEKMKLNNEQENKKSIENNEFLTEFEKLCTEVIRPVMEKIGNSLKERGHDYKIVTVKGNGIPYTKDENSYISINIYPYPHKRFEFSDHNTPSISFRTIVSMKGIYVNECNMMLTKGGSSGRIGSPSYNINEIKPEFIQENILSLLRKIL